jgi:hypothetical protein
VNLDPTNPANQSAKGLWVLEPAGRRSVTHPAAWDGTVRVRHVGSGMYLAVDHESGPEAPDEGAVNEVWYKCRLVDDAATAEDEEEDAEIAEEEANEDDEALDASGSGGEDSAESFVRSTFARGNLPLNDSPSFKRSESRTSFTEQPGPGGPMSTAGRGFGGSDIWASRPGTAPARKSGDQGGGGGEGGGSGSGSGGVTFVAGDVWSNDGEDGGDEGGEREDAEARALARKARKARGVRVPRSALLFRVHSADKTSATLLPFADLSVRLEHSFEAPGFDGGRTETLYLHNTEGRKQPAQRKAGGGEESVLASSFRLVFSTVASAQDVFKLMPALPAEAKLVRRMQGLAKACDLYSSRLSRPAHAPPDDDAVKRFFEQV